MLWEVDEIPEDELRSALKAAKRQLFKNVSITVLSPVASAMSYVGMSYDVLPTGFLISPLFAFVAIIGAGPLIGEWKKTVHAINRRIEKTKNPFRVTATTNTPTCIPH